MSETAIDSPLTDALTAVNNAQDAARKQVPDGTLGDFPLPAELTALRALADAVRDGLAPDQDADELAAQADRDARTMAPPVPGVTRNAGKTVFAAVRGEQASPGLLGSWYVAAGDDQGETAVWTAYTGEDGTLSYNRGEYGHGGPGEALVTLAHRAGVFGTLDELAGDSAGRTAFTQTRAEVMDRLHGIEGIARPLVRDTLTEAAALGAARLTRGQYTWAIRYDRMRCEFSLRRAN